MPALLAANASTATVWFCWVMSALGAYLISWSQYETACATGAEVA
jgi:hypothetical protein